MIIVFLLNDESADVFSFIIEDIKIDAFEMMAFDEFLSKEDRVDIVGVFIGCYDAFPGPFILFSE